jgi:hypothetical protein
VADTFRRAEADLPPATALVEPGRPEPVLNDTDAAHIPEIAWEAAVEFFEQKFAVEVFNAEATTALARKRGFPQTTADVISSAQIDFWACGVAVGYPCTELRKMESRYIKFDSKGEPKARPMRKGNVALLRPAS